MYRLALVFSFGLVLASGCGTQQPPESNELSSGKLRMLPPSGDLLTEPVAVIPGAKCGIVLEEAEVDQRLVKDVRRTRAAIRVSLEEIKADDTSVDLGMKTVDMTHVELLDFNAAASHALVGINWETAPVDAGSMVLACAQPMWKVPCLSLFASPSECTTDGFQLEPVGENVCRELAPSSP